MTKEEAIRKAQAEVSITKFHEAKWRVRLQTIHCIDGNVIDTWSDWEDGDSANADYREKVVWRANCLLRNRPEECEAMSLASSRCLKRPIDDFVLEPVADQ